MDPYPIDDEAGMPMVSSEGSLYHSDHDLSDEAPTSNSRSQPLTSTSNNLSLDDCGRWLRSIPASHITAVQNTRECRELADSIQKLERVYNRMLHQVNMNDPPSFLQYQTTDEILHFILRFLEAQSLARFAATCTRFRAQVVLHAGRRVGSTFQAERLMDNPLELVRAAEQVKGLFPFQPYVRIPILLLSRAVLLNDAGDEDFNGVYFCTGSNGNGFVFTKPRSSVSPLRRTVFRGHARGDMEEVMDFTSTRRYEPAGYRLQCIISKRFSNETLLWYCCKEVLVSTIHDDGNNTQDDVDPAEADHDNFDIIQRYAFWARLSMLGRDADYDLCRYPSQTSVLQRQGTTGWQSLSNQVQPPTVELID